MSLYPLAMKEVKGCENVERQQARTNSLATSLIVPGLITIFAGTMTFFMIVRPLIKVFEGRSWPAVPCQIISSEVTTSGSGDKTSYSFEIRYRYSFDGGTHESSRYDFMPATSRSRSSAEEVVSRYPAGSAATCYVNPRDPGEAVLRRDWSMWWGMLVPLAFFLLGAGMITHVIRGAKRTQPIARVPWEMRPDWAAGRIVCSSRTTMVVAWVFAVFWNAIAWPAVFALLPGAVAQNKAALLLVLFPIVGIALLGWAVLATKRWCKFAESVLELATVPGVVGGALEGRIRLRRGVRAENGFTVRLSCIRRYVSGTGKNRTVRESILWQDEAHIDVDFTDTVPVLFAIPADCPETNSDNPADQILWRLDASARLPGVDYVAQFEVPVFRVATSAQTAEQIAADDRVQMARQTALAGYQPPTNSAIRVENTPDGGAEFYFPPARNRGMAVGLTVFWVLWTVILVVIVRSGAPFLFPIVFGIFDLLILYGALYQWFAKVWVVVNPNGVTITGGLFVNRSRWLPASSVADITAVVGGTAQAGTALIPYYDVQIKLRSGETFIAGRGIKDGHEAQWLAAQMLHCLGR